MGLTAEIAKMTETLRRTCQTLQPVLVEQKNRSSWGNVALDREAVAPRLKKLAQCLLESDTEAQSILEEMQPMVSGTPMESAFIQIARHVAGLCL